jgi:hypothetical protein
MNDSCCFTLTLDIMKEVNIGNSQAEDKWRTL